MLPHVQLLASLLVRLFRFFVRGPANDGSHIIHGIRPGK